ncbi:stage VI sporulation protein F [Paenibacillus cymbidii]|uniref:stage VI sporulation protein F n=1 Tax=Paenibacillus cymbidii TaxID=1639034 RepID=UPI001080D87B|nr:stage VI sporulation protein F [Paenibacillus cymbidii]
MSYMHYGIEPQLVEQVKMKLKQPDNKERVKHILQYVTKSDLQNKLTVRKLVGDITRAIGIKLSERQTENIVAFVIAQKIDPNNTFHLLKLWGMFR